jgi:hypothetical protein
MKNLETRRSRPVTNTAGRRGAPVVRSESAAARRRERVAARTRELAQRRSGTLEILLLWHPQSDRVELCVRDLTTDVSFHLDVAPGDAVDAFYHPYAYAARRKKTGRLETEVEHRSGNN